MSSALIFEWKSEPLSPIFADEVPLVSEDEALYWTDLVQGELKFETKLASYESKGEVASRLLDDLDQLENLDKWIKPEEEPFSNCWFEEKMPIFDIESTTIIPTKPEPVKSIPDTQSLINEFQTVFDAVNHGTLTPPQSPVYEQPILTTLEPISAQQPFSITLKPEYTTNEKHIIDNILVYQRPPESIHLDYVAPTPQSNIAHELAVVDELVRTRAQDMVQWSNPPSPGSSSSNSGSSNFGDCSSDDPEWMPEPVETFDSSSLPVKIRKRTKPYTRVPPEDKKVRKKEQNKNAATRYRLKKKAEVEEILTEEKKLQKDNEDVSNKISDLQREIKYLKGLMRDLFKAKGLID